MVSIAVSKMGMTKLIFVKPGMKVNGQYYRDDLLSQQTLPAIKHVAGDKFVFQQDNAPSHRTKDTIKLLQQKTPNFFGLDLWPSNRPDLIRSWVLCSRKCMNVVWTVSMSRSSASLKSGTVCSRTLLTQPSTSGEKDWERACMQMDNILNIYCERVWLTFILKKMLLYCWACNFQGLKVSQGKIRTTKHVRWYTKPPFEGIFTP